MRLATIAQTKEIEKKAAQMGLSEELLMEAAGLSSARLFLERVFFKGVKASTKFARRDSRVLILCGPGHNGADGLVMARHLLQAGLENVNVVCLYSSSRVSPLYLTQLHRLKLQLNGSQHEGSQHGKSRLVSRRRGSKLREVELTQGTEGIGPLFSSASFLSSADFIVDALFGIGLKRELDGLFKELVTKINDANKIVFSLDIPSGLNADTGKGPCVKAKACVTFGVNKIGLFTGEGLTNSGQRYRAPIFPRHLCEEIACSHELIDERVFRKRFPSRGTDRRLVDRRLVEGNKFTFGHVMVVGGSPGMWGAGLLSCRASLRVGAGYVTWASFWGEPAIADSPEFLRLDLSAWTGTEPPWRKRPQAVVIGPGLGLALESDKGAEQFDRFFKLINLLMSEKIPMVVDADAMPHVVRQRLSGEKQAQATADFQQIIFTPHEGELRRLVEGEDEDSPHLSRLELGTRLQARIGGVFVIKGYRSYVVSEKKVGVCGSGDASLAKAGTGDVLAGLIGGLLARGLKPYDAASLGAFLHGRTAEDWVRHKKSPEALSPSELIDGFPSTLLRITN